MQSQENPEQFPESLLEVSEYFRDPDRCYQFLVSLRWPDGVITCPNCSSPDHYFLTKQKRYKCKKCRKYFSAKQGTIFENSPIPLKKWFVGMWLLANAKNGISSYEVHRGLKVTQKTAWFMLQRLRLILQEEPEGKLSGTVEVDETYIGGKARNMHVGKRKERIKGRGTTGKVIVMGLLERNGKVRLKVIGDIKRKTLQDHIKFNVEEGSEVHTDELKSYKGLDPLYVHNVINHAERYVEGHVHTNGMENFWSLLKRTIKGTYTSCEPFHLFRYLDE